MTDTRKSIKELYDEGMAEVFRVVGSLDATASQRKAARQTARDLSALLVAHTLQSIEGRTALLSGLIVELNQVIDSVKTRPPYEDSIEKLTGIVTKAGKLYADVKKELV